MQTVRHPTSLKTLLLMGATLLCLGASSPAFAKTLPFIKTELVVMIPDRGKLQVFQQIQLRQPGNIPSEIISGARGVHVVGGFFNRTRHTIGSQERNLLIRYWLPFHGASGALVVPVTRSPQQFLVLLPNTYQLPAVLNAHWAFVGSTRLTKVAGSPVFLEYALRPQGTSGNLPLVMEKTVPRPEERSWSTWLMQMGLAALLLGSLVWALHRRSLKPTVQGEALRELAEWRRQRFLGVLDESAYQEKISCWISQHQE